MSIREAIENDAAALKELYFNHLTAHPPVEEQDMALWRAKLRTLAEDPNHHIFVLEECGAVISAVTLVVIENLTHNLRPYALIENVVTHYDHRGKGFASALLARATEEAKRANCYKIMLLSGSKLDSTLNFYRNNGWNSDDKTGFVKWL